MISPTLGSVQMEHPICQGCCEQGFSNLSYMNKNVIPPEEHTLHWRTVTENQITKKKKKKVLDLEACEMCQDSTEEGRSRVAWDHQGHFMDQATLDLGFEE